MASVNVEDRFFKDRRVLDLTSRLGSREMAIGVCVEAWTLAQYYWKRDKQLIPKAVWMKQKMNNLLIDVGLVIEREDGYYVCGSKKCFAWLFQKVEAGRRGGVKSGESRRSKINKIPRSETKRDEAARSGAKPSSSSSSSSSSSTLTSPSSKGAGTASPPDKPATPTKDLIAFYCDHWKAKYGSHPPITGPVSGMLKKLLEELGEPRCRVLIAAYLQMPDSWFLTKRHDIATLRTNLNAVAQYADTGKMISKEHLRKANEAVDEVMGPKPPTISEILAEKKREAEVQLTLIADGGK